MEIKEEVKNPIKEEIKPIDDDTVIFIVLIYV
jgi:hypothetical protein